jgi:hypothetical protein
MEKKTGEAMRFRAVQKLMRIFSLLGLAALAISNATAADPAAEMASFSVFSGINVADLAKGEPKVAHGPALSGSVISAQSCFVVAGPPARVSEALRQWNPSRHSELKVLIHSDLPSSPSAANFSRLSSAPDNAAVRSLVAATQKLSPDLQISKAEEKRFAGLTGDRMAGPIAAAWADVLSARARAGRSGQPPYDHTGQNVRPSEELNALLRANDKVSRQFSGVLNGGPEPFWELLTADERLLCRPHPLPNVASGRGRKAGDADLARGLYLVGVGRLAPRDRAGRLGILDDARYFEGQLVISA